MITNPRDFHRLWSVILAGTEPSALDSFIKLWQGVLTPKPFCTFVGTRSLLQHTWDLADQFSHPESKVTIVTQPYLDTTCRQFGGRVPGLVATEPFQKGSLASALLGLAAIRAQDPESTLVVYPSQTFVHSKQNFLRMMQRAVWAAKLLHDRLVVFGASSEYAVGRYGWLRPTVQIGWTSGLPVQGLELDFPATLPTQSVPSPSPPRSDVLANSGVLLVKTEILWNVCEKVFPNVIPYLERLGSLIGRPEKHNQKTLSFQELPSGCLWKDFLCKIPTHLCMVEMEGVMWSDWESPTHIAETLSMLGKKPAFPAQWIYSENLSHTSLRQEAKF